ncbi:protein cortex-like [Copidosoma floridanum]|uniref:protein cortex-like n=1 Tax=Copidosoma floridanum TaxID=29053 RepID=UPI0006C9CD1E|nr:protein cortex-like [Copidosoma floridanum]
MAMNMRMGWYGGGIDAPAASGSGNDNRDNVNTTPRSTGLINRHVFNLGQFVNLDNRRSYLFHNNSLANDSFAKSISFTDFDFLHTHKSCARFGETNDRSEQLYHVVESSRSKSVGDRFIPRRNRVNNDLSHYRIIYEKEKDKDAGILDVFAGVKKATQHWRKKLMDSAFKVLGIFNELRSNRILDIGLQSTMDAKSHKKWELNDCGWDCRPRKQPLLIIKGDNSRHYRDYGAQIFHIALSIKFKNLIDFGPNNFVVLGLADHFYISDPKNSYKIKYKSYLCCVKWNPKGTQVAVSGMDGSTSLYDKTESKIIWSRKCGGCEEMLHGLCKVTCMEWMKKNKLIITGCDKGYISVVSSRAGYLIASAHFEREILAISVSPTEQYVAASVNNKRVKLFTYPNLVLAFEIEFHASIKAMAWHPWRRNVLCVGGGPGDGSLSLWNVSSRRQLGYRKVKFVGSVDCMMFNKLSGELVVHWYYLDGRRLRSKIVVLASLDEIVDAFPIHPEHRMLNIVWTPDHTKLGMQYRDTLVIWNFFGDDSDKWSRKNNGECHHRGEAEHSLLDNCLKSPTMSVAPSTSSLAHTGFGSFSYYTVR